MSLHSSWFRIVLSTAGAAIVFVAGCLSVAGAGTAVIPMSILAIGVVLLIGVILDYPISARFGPNGIQRRPLARRQLLTWNRVDGISRARPSLRLSTRGLAPGGLVAVVGRRRYLLVDRPESGAEFDRLVALLSQWDVDLQLGPRPSDEIVPTWMYRRARWAPDGDR